MDQVTADGSPSPPVAQQRPRRLDPRMRRGLLLALVLLAGVLAYRFALSRFDVQEEPVEQSYGAAADGGTVSVYMQPMQVDTTNGTMDVRVSILQPSGESGISPSLAQRNVRVLLLHDGRTEELAMRSKRPLPEATMRLYLQRGSVRDYPLDQYASLTRIIARDDADKVVPIHLRIWEGILGFSVRGGELRGSQATDLEISLEVQRTGAFAFFALVAYGAMVVMGLGALAIGALVFIGVRAIEVALVGAVASMVFALFGMRQALPSAPPLGIRADVLVFFWAQLAAALALCLLLMAWAERGARPPPGR